MGSGVTDGKALLRLQGTVPGVLLEFEYYTTLELLVCPVQRTAAMRVVRVDDAARGAKQPVREGELTLPVDGRELPRVSVPAARRDPGRVYLSVVHATETAVFSGPCGQAGDVPSKHAYSTERGHEASTHPIALMARPTRGTDSG